MWSFIQNEILGMQWLNRLIGSLIEAVGLDPTSRIGGSVQFFFYDIIKIMVLLGVLVALVVRRIRIRRQVEAMKAEQPMDGPVAVIIRTEEEK